MLALVYVCLVLFLLFVQNVYAISIPYSNTDGAINAIFCIHRIINTIPITTRYTLVFVNMDSNVFLFFSDIKPPFMPFIVH